MQAKEEEENRRKNLLTPESLGRQNERMKSEELLNEMELMDEEAFDEEDEDWEKADKEGGRTDRSL